MRIDPKRYFRKDFPKPDPQPDERIDIDFQSVDGTVNLGSGEFADLLKQAGYREVNEHGEALDQEGDLALPVLCRTCGRALANVGEWCCGRFTTEDNVVSAG